jgi:hypothetical protein
LLRRFELWPHDRPHDDDDFVGRRIGWRTDDELDDERRQRWNVDHDDEQRFVGFCGFSRCNGRERRIGWQRGYHRQWRHGG